MLSGRVSEEVKASGLRGRGGAGFPTGQKWELWQQRTAAERSWSATPTKVIPAPTWTAAF